MTSKEPFDETTKAFYRRFFEDKGLHVETERELFFRGRKIDIVVSCTDSEQNQLLIWQKILEVQDMKPKIREETWSYIDQFFRETPEAMTKLPSFQKTFQDAVQKAAQEVVQKAQEAAVQKAQEAIQKASADSHKLGEQQSRQQILIRQLRRKFTSLPKKVVQKIEATDDLEQLDNWLDQVIVVDSLAETGLLVTDKPDKK